MKYLPCGFNLRLPEQPRGAGDNSSSSSLCVCVGVCDGVERVGLPAQRFFLSSSHNSRRLETKGQILTVTKLKWIRAGCLKVLFCEDYAD